MNENNSPVKTINCPVNQATVITYNFLNINRTQLESVLEKNVQPAVKDIPEGIKINSVSASENTMNVKQTSCGPEFDEKMNSIMKENEFKCLKIEVTDGKTTDSPLFMEFACSENEKSFCDLEINAGKNSSSSFILFYNGAKNGSFGIRTKISAEENAVLKLYTVNLLDSSAVHFDSIGTEITENASLEIVQVELGALKTVCGSYNNLSSYKSNFCGFTAYCQKANQSMDINYVSRQPGKESESAMKVNGVLLEDSQKTWRGTIDFVRGAKNAVGNETEDVLLLSPSVVNKTLPVILCDEEAVEGHHGASIGRLDEDMLFYLQTRGVDSETAQKLMIKAKINAVSNQIPDEGLQEKINSYLEEAI